MATLPPDVAALAAHFASLPHTRSWVDVHVYWEPASAQGVAAMHRVRASLMGVAGVQLFEPVDHPIGPHPQAMFEAHVAHARAGEVAAFLHARGEGLSVLVHPHTRDGVRADHTTHARWVNVPLDLGPCLARMGV